MVRPSLMSQRDPIDFTELSWSAAFAALCAFMDQTYVFTRWKALDWNDYQVRFHARLQDAEQRAEVQTYYLTLREALFGIGDANVHLWGDDWDLQRSQLQARYGLQLVQLDDGRVLVSQIAAGGAAHRAGLDKGTQILKWNDVPIETALRQTSVLWAEHPPATTHATRLLQCLFLTRAPQGTQARVQCLKTKSNKPEAVTLTSGINDPSDDTLPVYAFPENCVVESTLLPSGIAHIVLRGLPREPLPGIDTETIYEQFQEAILHLARAGAVGLVIDLRNCAGTNHKLAARLAGYFHRQPIFYAMAGYRNNADSSKLKPDARTLLQVIPQGLYWQSPVAVLVNVETLGAAEGLARALQRALHSTVVGTTPSGGSFGHLTAYPLAEVWMPEGYAVTFPAEAGLNQDGVIQIESNRFAEGGVRPTVRIPMNLRTFEEIYLARQDVELAFAVQSVEHALRQPRPQRTPGRSEHTLGTTKSQ